MTWSVRCAVSGYAELAQRARIASFSVICPKTWTSQAWQKRCHALTWVPWVHLLMNFRPWHMKVAEEEMGTEIIVRIMTLDEQDSPLLLKTPPPPPRLFQTIRILLPWEASSFATTLHWRSPCSNQWTVSTWERFHTHRRHLTVSTRSCPQSSADEDDVMDIVDTPNTLESSISPEQSESTRSELTQPGGRAVPEVSR